MSIVVFALSALIAILVVTALTPPLARRIGQPMPVVLAAVGIAYGIVTTVLGASPFGGILDSYDLWFVEQLALDSESLLYVFLPPLLFEMALAVNVRRLFDDIWTVLVMAVLAVFAATASVALGLWLVSDIAIVACALLAAAVATTDPAAVITTFREIGAPRRLLVILEGESLLNDAAAIAIFSILLALVNTGAEPTVEAFVGGFLWSFAAGAASGLGIAVAVGRLYPWLARSTAAETSLTVAVAYGSYMLAEQVTGGSGVVAVVFAGLATGSAGFVRMGPGNWNTVRAVWAQIGFWANALILLLVASLVPGLVLDLGWEFAALVPVIYLGAALSRGWILFGVLPMLDRLGLAAPIGNRQKLLVLWGGVRGAVTLVLALSLADIGALGEEARTVAALAAAYTIATLFLNASTLALATALLGLDRLSASDLALRERIVAGSIQRVRTVVAELARARDLEPEALAEVEDALGRQKSAAEAQADSDSQGERIPFGERLRLGLTMLAGQELRLVRRAFEEGAIGPRATTALRLQAERIADGARTGGRAGYEAAAEDALAATRAYRVAVLLHNYLRADRPLRAQIELLLTRLLETERVVRELKRFGATVLPPMIGEDAARNIAALLAERHAAVNAAIDAIGAQYPRYAGAMEKTLITRTAIRRERQQYMRLLNDGVIGQELHDDLIRSLDRRERIAAQPPRLDLSLTPRALLDRMPLFSGLDEAQRLMVARLLRTRFTVPEEVVLEAGTRGTEMFFVASGAFEVDDGMAPVTIGSGTFFGEVALVSPHRRRRSRVTSKGFCRLLVLSQRDFARLGRSDPALDRLIREAATRQMREGFGAAGRSSDRGRPARHL